MPLRKWMSECKRNHIWSDSCFHPVFLGFLLSPTLSRSSLVPPRTEQPATKYFTLGHAPIAGERPERLRAPPLVGRSPLPRAAWAPRVQANSPPSSGPPRWSPGEIRALPESTEGLITQQLSNPLACINMSMQCMPSRPGGRPSEPGLPLRMPWNDIDLHQAGGVQ